MKHYIDDLGQLRAIGEADDIDGDQLELVQSTWTELTPLEVDAILNPPKTQAELDAEALATAIQAKEDALNSITVTTTNGNIFDGRDKDQARMLSVIQASKTLVAKYTAAFNAIASPTVDEQTAFDAAILSATTTEWKMHDNNKVLITIDELEEAQALAIQELGAIILASSV